jgi:hypothetical protein
LPGLLDERGRGQQRVGLAGQRAGRGAVGRAGHEVTSATAVTASLVMVSGSGMTLANDAGPRKKAAAAVPWPPG